jgi:hypothetical protein
MWLSNSKRECCLTSHRVQQEYRDSGASADVECGLKPNEGPFGKETGSERYWWGWEDQVGSAVRGGEGATEVATYKLIVCSKLIGLVVEIETVVGRLVDLLEAGSFSSS